MSGGCLHLFETIIGAATSDRQDRTSAKKSAKLREASVVVALHGREGKEKRAIVGVGRNSQRALRRDEGGTAQCASLIAPYGSGGASGVTLTNVAVRGLFPIQSIPESSCKLSHRLGYPRYLWPSFLETRPYNHVSLARTCSQQVSWHR